MRRDFALSLYSLCIVNFMVMYDEIFFFVIKTIIKEDVKARRPCAGSLQMAWLQGSPLSWRQNGV